MTTYHIQNCPPPPPPKPELCGCVCTDNDGRDVAYVRYETFIDHVRPALTFTNKSGERHAAPTEAMLQSIREVCIDFAKRTRILRRKFWQPIQAGVRDYYIKTHEQERIALINRLCVRGLCIEPSQLQCCQRDRCVCGGGGFLFEPMDKVVLDEKPYLDNSCDGVEATFHVHPSEGSCMVDELLFERYRQAVVWGVWARMLALPGWEWADAAHSVKYNTDYEREVADAKIEVSQSFASGYRAAHPVRTF